MESIRELIKSKRPSLSESSITTYASILKSLNAKVFGNDFKSSNFVDHVDKVLEHLKSVPANKRKTILSCLFVVTGKKEYRQQMLDDITSYNADIAKQEKTPEQEESWLTKDQVVEALESLEKTAKLLIKKPNLTISDLQEIQQYVILSLLSGVWIPPRRSMDFVEFKIKNISKDKDNYLIGNKMVFNRYKTASTYGKQEVMIPKQLKAILTKWISINPTEYLLFDQKMNQLTNVKLNQRLNKIFGTKASVNALRHTFLTEKYGHTIEEKKEIAETMSEMGSSSKQLDLYVKK